MKYSLGISDVQITEVFFRILHSAKRFSISDSRRWKGGYNRKTVSVTELKLAAFESVTARIHRFKDSDVTLKERRSVLEIMGASADAAAAEAAGALSAA